VLLKGALNPGNHGGKSGDARSGWGCGKGEFGRRRAPELRFGVRAWSFELGKPHVLRWCTWAFGGTPNAKRQTARFAR
jgi:hypothetical protein